MGNGPCILHPKSVHGKKWNPRHKYKHKFASHQKRNASATQRKNFDNLFPYLIFFISFLWTGFWIQKFTPKNGEKYPKITYFCVQSGKWTCSSGLAFSFQDFKEIKGRVLLGGQACRIVKVVRVVWVFRSVVTNHWSGTIILKWQRRTYHLGNHGAATASENRLVHNSIGRYFTPTFSLNQKCRDYHYREQAFADNSIRRYFTFTAPPRNKTCPA